jgi:hypothetical protein
LEQLLPIAESRSNLYSFVFAMFGAASYNDGASLPGEVVSRALLAVVFSQVAEALSMVSVRAKLWASAEAMLGLGGGYVCLIGMTQLTQSDMLDFVRIHFLQSQDLR